MTFGGPCQYLPQKHFDLFDYLKKGDNDESVLFYFVKMKIKLYYY